MVGANEAQVDAVAAPGSAATRLTTIEPSQIRVGSSQNVTPASGVSSLHADPSPPSALKQTQLAFDDAAGDETDAKKAAGEQEVQRLREEMRKMGDDMRMMVAKMVQQDQAIHSWQVYYHQEQNTADEDWEWAEKRANMPFAKKPATHEQFHFSPAGDQAAGRQVRFGNEPGGIPPIPLGMSAPNQWYEATEPATEEWPYNSAGANAWWQQDPLMNKDPWKQDAYENGYKHWSYDGGGYNAG